MTHIAGGFFPRCSQCPASVSRHLSLAAIILFRLLVSYRFLLFPFVSLVKFPSSVLSSMLLFASPQSPFLIAGFVRLNFARLRFVHAPACSGIPAAFPRSPFFPSAAVRRGFVVGDLGYLHPPFPVSFVPSFWPRPIIARHRLCNSSKLLPPPALSSVR